MEFPQTFGPYEIVRKIASGGMAEIYLARLVGLGGFHKTLVLKMIHPRWSADEAFIQMLVEEAKLAVQLNHTNIAQVFDLGKHADVYYIAMEYVDCRDLFQLLVRTSELDTYIPFEFTAFIIEQICAALHYAHTLLDAQGQPLNIIHRDVSPQNILVSFGGAIKLIDFGIAKAQARQGHTQAGVIKGKFYYMSPEQAWGKSLNHATDQFSLGIILHEMLTGQMLYTEEDPMLLLEQVRRANIPPPSTMRPGVPPELEAIAMRALDPDPMRRFESCYTFQRALTDYLHRNFPGFTPTRVSRLMWDLFPREETNTQPTPSPTPTPSPVPSSPLDDPHSMQRSDFIAAQPPDSVIFDLNADVRARIQPTTTPTNLNQPTTPPPSTPRSFLESSPLIPARGDSSNRNAFEEDPTLLSNSAELLSLNSPLQRSPLPPSPLDDEEPPTQLLNIPDIFLDPSYTPQAAPEPPSTRPSPPTIPSDEEPPISSTQPNPTLPAAIEDDGPSTQPNPAVPQHEHPDTPPPPPPPTPTPQDLPTHTNHPNPLHTPPSPLQTILAHKAFPIVLTGVAFLLAVGVAWLTYILLSN